MDNFQTYLKKVDANQLKHETYTRKYSIIFGGVDEKDQEDTHAEVMKIISDNLQITLNMVDFDKIHHYGRSMHGKPRPIMAKCFSLTVRDNIFRNANKLANTNIYISQDVAEQVRAQRAELRTVVMHAKQQGHNDSGNLRVFRMNVPLITMIYSLRKSGAINIYLVSQTTLLVILATLLSRIT